MKKNKKITIVLIIVLAFIAAGTFVFSGFGEKTPEFEADPIADEGDKTESWSENESTATNSGTSSDNSELPHEQLVGTPEDEYPMVVEQSDGEVVISFTDPDATEQVATPITTEDAPELPQTEMPTEPPAVEHPPEAYTNPETPPAPTPPTQGATNNNGQVYDEAFGWITPSGTSGGVVDNAGDVNKQVGNMG